MVAKGFKKKYFSLAAIAATVSMVQLGAVASEVAQIEKVVVSASKMSEAADEVTEDIEVFDASDIEELGARNLAELLQFASGVSIVSNGGIGKASSLYLRGLNSDKVLVLIDGVRFNDPSNIAGVDFWQIMLDNVERVEIIKGAQSGIWGADAASGVINIITKPQKSFKLSYGSFDTYNARLATAQKNGSFFYNLALSYFKTDGYSAITPYKKNPKDYEADGYINRKLHFKTGFDDGDVHFDIGTIYINAYNEADGYNPKTYQPDPNSRNNDKFHYNAYFVNTKKSFANHQLSLHADTTTTKRYFLDTTWGVDRFRGESENVELRDSFDYTAGKAQIALGYQRFGSKYHDTSANEGSVSYHDKYGYIVNKNRFGNLIFMQNIRYDNYDRFKNQWTGKVGVRYNFAKGAIFANYATAYNVPNQIKMINPWGKPNFNLNPEKTRSYDIGVEGYGARVVYFEERVKDLINWYDPDYDTYGDEYYTNFAGTSKFKGIEASIAYALSDELFAKLSYTYLDPKDAQGNYLPRRARQKVGLILNYYPTSEHTITFNGYYVGERYDDAAKTKQTGKYFVANLTLSHQFAKNFKGSVIIKNIFDRRYQEVYGYGAEPRGFYVAIEGRF